MKVPIVFMRKAENDMKYAICYSSRTGNTGKLAEAIRQTLPTLDSVSYTHLDVYKRQAEKR